MILAENMTKWGYPNSMVTGNDPKDFGKLKHFFDVIVADLPCSGEGMFRKDRNSRQDWSMANVELCAARQRRIIHDAWDSLKPGGYLVYSTCTFNTEENEDNIAYAAGKLGAEIIEIRPPLKWNITGSLKHDLPACRFFPHKTDGEGFFMALLQKKGSCSAHNASKSISPARSNGQNMDILLSPDKFLFIDNRAVMKTNFNHYQTVHKSLKVISCGINWGEWKGKDFIPSISLALSSELNRDRFPNIELSRNEAIKYLRSEVMLLPEGTPKGHVLVTYRNVPLGFVKNLGSRANNLYPKEWRIRSGIHSF
jgi:NOL1/NOP2/fmu family ribosome biogenesis protein